MNDPVTFTVDRQNRSEAMLGKTLVGIVAPYPYAGTSFGSVHATWQMRLPVNGAIEMAKPATSLTAGRRSLLFRLAQWHEEADPERYAMMIAALKAQAEGEK